MRYLFLSFLLLATGCGSKKLKNDISPTNDADSKYESVLTSVEQDYGLGSKVYVVDNVNEDLHIYTLLDGTYEVRSDSCGFIESGRYTNSESIDIPISKFFSSIDEKLCTVSIQINPELKNSQVAIFPRYSIVYLQMSSRVLKGNFSKQTPKGFPIDNALNYQGAIDKYRVIRKCTYESVPQVVKESTSPVTAITILKKDISVGMPSPAESNIGSCLFSVVFTESGISSRIMFSTSVYDSAHDPLSASITTDAKKISVVSTDAVSFCGINRNIKNDYKCSEKISNLEKVNIIQVHTNKRSRYYIWSKP